jgi:hypothetical protein
MSINVEKNNILLDNKIVFIRKYPKLNFPNKEERKKKLTMTEKKLHWDQKLPPPLWCINEKNGCKCKKTFRNPYMYKLHSEVCLFDEKNELKEEENISSEDIICNLDDTTINMIESYERMTGNNIMMQILLGQVNYNFIDKIINDYYNDEDYLYLCDEDFIYDNVNF